MTVKAVLTGAHGAVLEAVTAADWRSQGIELIGAAIVGGGEIDMPVLARAPAWEALQFDQTGGQAVILAGAPSVAITRVLLARAAEARMRVLLLEEGRVRPLSLND